MNDRKQMAQFALLMFITGLLLYICWLMLAPFVSILLWSAILVIIFHPLYKKLLAKTKKHALSAIITILISMLTFIVPVMLVSASVVNEISGISVTTVDEIKKVISDLQGSRFSFIYMYLSGVIDLEQIVKPEDIQAFISRMSEFMLSASMSFVEGIFGMIIGIVFSIFAMFYLFRDGEKIVRDIPNILPMDNNQAKQLIRETSELINATLRGSLFIAVLQGTLAGIMFWILDIPSFLLLGMLAMLFSLIPTGGTAFVTVPIILILFISGEYWKGIVLTIYASTVIGMIDNFLLPKLIKQRVKMNELFVFFSVIGGLQLFGILGLFMGPIILAMALGVFKIFRGEKLDKGTVSM